jgi:GT2 family glycosyltransferase
MRYGAVVLYYQLGERIHETLNALVSQSSPPERIVLVDNASGDGVLDGAESRYPGCMLLRMQTNVGYAAGMNVGTTLLHDDVEAVLFLTHEVLVMPDCAAQLIHALKSDAAVGMVGPALYLADGKSLWSLGGVITRYGDVCHNLSKESIHTVRWLDGACLLVRVALLRDCGGFDEDYFLYWEDVDISLRVADRVEIRCVPEAVALQDTATAPIYLRVRNQIMCWRKNGGSSAVAMAVLTAVAKMLFTDIRSGSMRQLRARCLGVLHGFSGQLAPPPIRMLRERRS